MWGPSGIDVSSSRLFFSILKALFVPCFFLLPFFCWPTVQQLLLLLHIRRFSPPFSPVSKPSNPTNMSFSHYARSRPVRDGLVSSQTVPEQLKEKPLPASHTSEVESALDTTKSPQSVVSTDEEAQPILPEPTETPVASPLSSPRYAKLRWRVWTIYRRLFSIVFIANLVAFVVVIRRDRLLTDFVNAAAANLLGVGLARQPLVVNLLFRIFCSLPRTAPLRLRRLAAKIFHYGGVHSGCGVASFVW